jgi:hypothetical protein
MTNQERWRDDTYSTHVGVEKCIYLSGENRKLRDLVIDGKDKKMKGKDIPVTGRGDP